MGSGLNVPRFLYETWAKKMSNRCWNTIVYKSNEQGGMAIYRGQSRYYHLVVYKERKIVNDSLIRVTDICQLEEKFGGVAALKKGFPDG